MPAQFDYTGHCLPQGMTRSMNSPFPIEIIQAPKRVAILFEAWNVFHVVPTDGRGFPKNIEPTWIGTSIGRWEGDTLVVETKGFNGRTNLDTVGHPHSDQLRLTQRFTRSDAQHIAYEVTVDDPATYTQAVEERADLHAQAGLGNHGILLHGEQQGPARGPHQVA